MCSVILHTLDIMLVDGSIVVVLEDGLVASRKVLLPQNVYLCLLCCYLINYGKLVLKGF